MSHEFIRSHLEAATSKRTGNVRPTSPRTKELIQRLYGSHSSRDYVALLSEIGDSNEPAAIVDILPFIHQKGEVAFAAADALHKLLLGTTRNELAWLDAAVRRGSMYGKSDAYDWYKTPAKENCGA